VWKWICSQLESAIRVRRIPNGQGKRPVFEPLERRMLLSGSPWTSGQSDQDLSQPAAAIHVQASPEDSVLQAAARLAGHESGVHDEYVHYGLITEKFGDKDTYVHQWIAAQAAAFYLNQFGGAELSTYLGTIEGSDKDKQYPVDTTTWKQFTGDTVLEGTYEEDTLGVWYRHFVAGGEGDELTTGLAKVPSDDDLILNTLLKGAVTPFVADPSDGRYFSAYEVAQDLWQQALTAYQQGDKALAYYRLGRVAHLLVDMTTPAHVHNDRHTALQGDGDFFEITTADSKRFLLWGVAGQRGGPAGEVRQYAGLEDLFRTTVRYTEEYPSWNTSGVLQVAGDEDSGIAKAGRHRPDLVSEAGGFSMEEYWTMADDLIPYAMEQTAALYRLFYQQVDTAAPTVEWVTPFGASAAESAAQSARLVAEVHADDSVSGTASHRFDFLIEKETDGGWSESYHSATSGSTLTLRVAEDGSYRIRATVQDAVGHPASTDYGYFTVTDALTCPPLVTVDSLTTSDTTPALHGTVDDPAAGVSVEVDGRTYPAVNSGDGTWTLADGTISPALAGGTYDVKVTAVDSRSNVGTDSTSNELTIQVYHEDFSDTDLSDWMIVDQGRWLGPSRWSVVGGALTESSGVRRPEWPWNVARLGTLAVYRGGLAWTDYSVSLSLRSQDNHDLGVVFRYQDANNYYRFSWNGQTGVRRLVVCRDGRFTVLASDVRRYERGTTYAVEVKAHGPVLEVEVDGATILSATDATLERGTFGLYSSGNRGSAFDDILVDDLAGVNLAPRITRVGAAADTISDSETVQVQVAAQDFDAGPSSLTYHWTVPDGRGVLDDPSSASPVFTPSVVSGVQTVTLTVAVSDGQDTAQGTVDVVVRGTSSPVLLADDFTAGTLDGWSIVEEGNWGRPAQWSAAGGVLHQTSPIRRLFDGIAARGTYALSESGAAWTDTEVDLNLASGGDGRVGVMFRVRDPNNYYRFSWDCAQGTASLVRCLDGRFERLAITSFRAAQDRTYGVVILARQSRLQVYVEGRLLLSAQDSRLASGRIALYSSADRASRFDDVTVREI
jgi:hypothetical protein